VMIRYAGPPGPTATADLDRIALAKLV
jgi:hypothetical protein